MNSEFFRVKAPTDTGGVSYRVQEKTPTRGVHTDPRNWRWHTIALCHSKDDAVKIYSSLLNHCENED